MRDSAERLYSAPIFKGNIHTLVSVQQDKKKPLNRKSGAYKRMQADRWLIEHMKDIRLPESIGGIAW